MNKLNNDTPVTPDTQIDTPVRCRWTGDRLSIVEHLRSGLVKLSDGSVGEYDHLAVRDAE